MQGEQNAMGLVVKKWSAGQARAAMAAMRNPPDHPFAGRRVFSRRMDPDPEDPRALIPNPYGILLAENKIMQFFSKLTADAKKPPKKTKVGIKAYTVAQLQAVLKGAGQSANGKKDELWQQLEAAVAAKTIGPEALFPHGRAGAEDPPGSEAADVAPRGAAAPPTGGGVQQRGGSVIVIDEPRQSNRSAASSGPNSAAAVLIEIGVEGAHVGVDAASMAASGAPAMLQAACGLCTSQGGCRCAGDGKASPTVGGGGGGGGGRARRHKRPASSSVEPTTTTEEPQKSPRTRPPRSCRSTMSR